MKRIKLLLLFTALSTTGIFSQYSANYRGFDRSEYRIQVQEYRDFEYALEQFSYAIMTNNLPDARYLKRQILRDMEREIAQTRRALHQTTNSSTDITYSKREPDWRIPQMHSRGNGRNQNDGQVNHYAVIVHRLEMQERLFYRFSELRLTDRNRDIINENEHRRIMYRFIDSMGDELLDERTNPRRGR